MPQFWTDPNSVGGTQDWWGRAFPQVPYEKGPPGENEMLTVVAYDISDPKRLAKAAKICEDFGVRVQYSIFECHVDQETFNEFWLKLLEVIDEEDDRLVAYKLDARCARETETAGTMVCSEKAVCYLV
ncbi:MAG: CRISPR-associated endonuclease Cas2 [Limisphaerales bacterium]